MLVLFEFFLFYHYETINIQAKVAAWNCWIFQI